MNEVIQGTPPTEEQKHLATLFREIEKGQLDLLDASAKRIIELTTALLSVLFAITAFGDKFPPPYLRANSLVKIFAVLSLASFLAGTFCALLVMQPRDYTYNPHRIDELRATLHRIIRIKSRALRFAGLLFFAGLATLAFLIIALIVAA